MKTTLLTPLFCLFSLVVCAQTSIDHIHIDQFGYLPDAQKVAVLTNPQVGFNASESYTPGNILQVIDESNNEVVFSGTPESWNNGDTHTQSGDQAWWFDFSTVNTIGTYSIYDPTNNVSSYPFDIRPDVYNTVLEKAVKAFYYQRCGVQKTEEFGGAWNDGICHLGSEQDLDCRLVSDPDNVSLAKDLSGGWHDAGDYNKYVTFTYMPMHDLLAAYEINPSIWSDETSLPESGNGIPDLLDEVKFELDWLLKMQLEDGQVLSKVSATDFDFESPPSEDSVERRYGPPHASATRATASIFAHAAIVFEGIGESDYASLLLQQSILAWDWITENPDYSFYDNEGFLTASPEVATYLQDDFLMAAAIYLFAATGEEEYKTYVDQNYTNINPISWTFWYVFQSPVQDALLYYSELPSATPAVADAIRNSFSTSMSTNNPDFITALNNEIDPYRAHMKDDDYVWGNTRDKSHAGSMYQHLLRLNLFNSDEEEIQYRNAAADYLHYLHGVNPMNMVFMSNMYECGAEKSANEIYHNWFLDGSIYDNALTSQFGPPPGILPGGVNGTYEPDDEYTGPPISPPENQPIQKSYKDWNTSFPENSWSVTENGIYYQAAYINFLTNFITNEIPLPVKLSFFNAELLEDRTVLLTWESLSEVNSSHFEVERSFDLQSWATIATVEAAENSTDTLQYQSIDSTPEIGTNYYRLKLIDETGEFTYSDLEEIVLPNEEITMVVYPNPVTNLLIIEGQDIGNKSFTIINQIGKIESFTDAIVDRSTNQISIDVSGLANGIYFLRINGETYSIVKQ